jgi:hypothetical protein
MICESSDVLWELDATYVLENTKQKKRSLDVGFPSRWAHNDQVVYEGMKVEVDGAPVEIISTEGYGQVPAKKGDDKWIVLSYHWSLEFDPGQTRTVRVSYTVRSRYKDTFIYQLPLAGNWKGAIDTVDVVVRVGDGIVDYSGTMMDHLKAVRGQFHGEPVVVRDGLDSTLTWHLEDIEPLYGMYVDTATYTGARCKARRKAIEWFLEAEGSEDASRHYDVLLATFGKTFEDEDVQAGFEKKQWYVPHPDFDIARYEDVEWELDLGGEKDEMVGLKWFEKRIESLPSQKVVVVDHAEVQEEETVAEEKPPEGGCSIAMVW